MSLKYNGKGYLAEIAPALIGDAPTYLNVRTIFNEKTLFISQDDCNGRTEQVVLVKDEILALRDYLVQICPTL